MEFWDKFEYATADLLPYYVRARNLRYDDLASIVRKQFDNPMIVQSEHDRVNVRLRPYNVEKKTQTTPVQEAHFRLFVGDTDTYIEYPSAISAITKGITFLGGKSQMFVVPIEIELLYAHMKPYMGLLIFDTAASKILYFNPAGNRYPKRQTQTVEGESYISDVIEMVLVEFAKIMNLDYEVIANWCPNTPLIYNMSKELYADHVCEFVDDTSDEEEEVATTVTSSPLGDAALMSVLFSRELSKYCNDIGETNADITRTGMFAPEFMNKELHQYMWLLLVLSYDLHTLRTQYDFSPHSAVYKPSESDSDYLVLMPANYTHGDKWWENGFYLHDCRSNPVPSVETPFNTSDFLDHVQNLHKVRLYWERMEAEAEKEAIKEAATEMDNIESPICQKAPPDAVSLTDGPKKFMRHVTLSDGRKVTAAVIIEYFDSE